MQKYFVSYYWKTTWGKGYGQNVIEVESGVHGMELVRVLMDKLEQSHKGCVMLNFIKLE